MYFTYNWIFLCEYHKKSIPYLIFFNYIYIYKKIELYIIIMLLCEILLSS